MKRTVGQKVQRFWADHTELSQFADRFANRFLRVMKVRHGRGVCSALLQQQ
jgi:hypothetical protein